MLCNTHAGCPPPTLQAETFSETFSGSIRRGPLLLSSTSRQLSRQSPIPGRTKVVPGQTDGNRTAPIRAVQSSPPLTTTSVDPAGGANTIAAYTHMREGGLTTPPRHAVPCSRQWCCCPVNESAQPCSPRNGIVCARQLLCHTSTPVPCRGGV